MQLANPADLGSAKTGELAFHHPQLRPDPSALSPEQLAVTAASQRTLAVYAGDPFCYDPKLHGRLRRVTVPVLVIAGEQARRGRGISAAAVRKRLKKTAFGHKIEPWPTASVSQGPGRVGTRKPCPGGRRSSSGLMACVQTRWSCL